MIIYNVTIKVSKSIADNWLQWLKEEHIPEVTSTGCFTNANILQLLEIDDDEGPTYAIQYFAESREKYDFYIENFADLMREKSYQKWGDQFIAFRSVMKIVQ
ncbi:MAG: DUF4286 family protein [Ferruginibacter sp.]